MTLEGWIFMVGLRVFDVGGLIVWLVWFFKLRDEDADDEDERPDDGGSDRVEPDGPPPVPGGPPLADADPWPSRRRGHGDDGQAPRRPRRGAPVHAPERVPARDR